MGRNAVVAGRLYEQFKLMIEMPYARNGIIQVSTTIVAQESNNHRYLVRRYGIAHCESKTNVVQH